MSDASHIINAIKRVLADADTPAALHEPCFEGKEWDYVKECIDTGWVSSVGSYVDLFEEKLAEYCGVSHAVVTVNGTAALQVGLTLAGVEKDDEVLIPSLTFVATANAVHYCCAIPHFVESERTSLGIDAEKLSAYLEDIADIKDSKTYNKNTGRRIAALVPVHIFGHPVDFDALEAIANQYNIPIVCDGAEALGSRYKGKPACSLGLISTLSFNGNKIITTGGGGAILTNNADLAARAKHVTNVAKTPHQWAYHHDEIGYNYRMPNVNAALGCAQLEQLEGFLKLKRNLAESYKQVFENLENVEFMIEPDYASSNYWLNAIMIATNVDRDQILDDLCDSGYQCRPIWTGMHKLPMYTDCPKMDLSVCEELESRVINIPSSAKLGKI